jgi:hypothetical protein
VGSELVVAKMQIRRATNEQRNGDEDREYFLVIVNKIDV